MPAIEMQGVHISDGEIVIVPWEMTDSEAVQVVRLLEEIAPDVDEPGEIVWAARHGERQTITRT